MLVCYDYFQLEYIGLGVTPEDFPRVEKRAEEAIDNLTRGALARFPEFPPCVQELVRKAICAQIEYYGLYGSEIGFKAEDGGFTVGKVTVQGGGKESGDKMFYSPRAIGFLERAGLMNRAVGVLC